MIDIKTVNTCLGYLCGYKFAGAALSGKLPLLILHIAVSFLIAHLSLFCLVGVMDRWKRPQEELPEIDGPPSRLHYYLRDQGQVISNHF